jgi:thioredoxin 1
MSALLHVSDASFEAEVIKSNVPVLVDFWAEWCGPCRMIAPILEDLAQEYAGKVKIVKVNVDENSVSAATYGVRGIPTLLLFKNGQVADTKVGALPKGQLAAFIDSNI